MKFDSVLYARCQHKEVVSKNVLVICNGSTFLWSVVWLKENHMIESSGMWGWCWSKNLSREAYLQPLFNINGFSFNFYYSFANTRLNLNNPTLNRLEIHVSMLFSPNQYILIRIFINSTHFYNATWCNKENECRMNVNETKAWHRCVWRWLFVLQFKHH